MQVLGMLGNGLFQAFSMFWETLWALVLGFGLSGAVQAFVSRERMQKVLGDHRPATLAKSSLFGVISSSCSYAASALAKSLFVRGADLTTSLVFMIASTNLVVELGLVLWLLIGWQFALAEFVGGTIMIVLLGLVLPRILPSRLAEPARAALAERSGGLGSGDQQDADAARPGIRTRRGWSTAAAYTISDVTMLRKELIIGFLVAGILSALVPAAFWQSIFLTGHGFLSSLENAIVGPFLAIISFVCSVGNVPLAAALWHGGISFGGVVSFVFADLITLPLLAIYRGYYGRRITARILIAFWACMSVTGLAVEYLFRLIRIPAPPRQTQLVAGGIGWNYTTALNILALIAFGILYWLYRTRKTNSRYAKDPVCGMQVEIANAGATRSVDGNPVYFCSDRCATRFDQIATHHLHTELLTSTMSGHHHDQVTAETLPVDPVCGMMVDPATAAGQAVYDGTTYYFISVQRIASGVSVPTQARSSHRPTVMRDTHDSHRSRAGDRPRTR